METPPGRERPVSTGMVLIVDDEEAVRDTIADMLTHVGYATATAGSAGEALAAIELRLPDIVLTDVHMPGTSGVELCRRIKADRRWSLVPVVILTGIADLESRVAGLAAGADDFFAKPVDFLELRTRIDSLLRSAASLAELERTENVLLALGLTVEARDPYTGAHCRRLSLYGEAVGRRLGLSDSACRALRLGGFLHDLGKIAVPDHVLLKPGPLEPAERELMKIHPVVGAELLSSLRSMHDVIPIVRHHHERMDGSGYPDGLRGEAIPLVARIMAVVDVYDALTSTRPYKAAMSRERALQILREETAAGAWDPQVLAAFEVVLDEYPDSDTLVVPTHIAVLAESAT